MTLVVLLVLLLVPPALLSLPGTPGRIRLAGVALAWWYAGVVVPLVAGVLATVALFVSAPE